MRIRVGILAILALLAGCIVHGRVRSTRVEPAMTVADVVDMTRRGVSEETILLMLQYHGVNRTLSPEDIVYLKREGVRDRVIEAMIEARPRPPEVVTYYTYTPPLWYFGNWYLFWWGGTWYWHHGHRWNMGIHWRLRP